MKFSYTAAIVALCAKAELPVQLDGIVSEELQESLQTAIPEEVAERLQERGSQALHNFEYRIDGMSIDVMPYDALMQHFAGEELVHEMEEKFRDIVAQKMFEAEYLTEIKRGIEIVVHEKIEAIKGFVVEDAVAQAGAEIKNVIHQAQIELNIKDRMEAVYYQVMSKLDTDAIVNLAMTKIMESRVLLDGLAQEAAGYMHEGALHDIAAQVKAELEIEIGAISKKIEDVVAYTEDTRINEGKQLMEDVKDRITEEVMNATQIISEDVKQQVAEAVQNIKPEKFEEDVIEQIVQEAVNRTEELIEQSQAIAPEDVLIPAKVVEEIVEQAATRVQEQMDRTMEEKIEEAMTKNSLSVLPNLLPRSLLEMPTGKLRQMPKPEMNIDELQHRLQSELDRWMGELRGRIQFPKP